MKNILIINLRRLGDIYSTSHLINSLYYGEAANITLLTYKENIKAAKNIKNVSKIIEIDRKEIITLMKNKLFSSAFAFEKLFETMKGIKSTHWDSVINYSNDNVSTLLATYLKSSAKNITGIHYSNDRRIEINNSWELLFNEILPTIKHSPIHFVDCYHNMLGISLLKDGDKLITNPKHNEHAFNQFNQIKKERQLEAAKLIGIQLKTSSAAKDIPEKVLVELIMLLSKNSNVLPLLLIAPIEEERKIAQDINEYFDNQLVIIEADLKSVASVLLNLDLLITPDTVIKHIADLVETPVLELSIGNAPLLKQGTYSRDGLILSDCLSLKESLEFCETNIKASDVNACALYALSSTKLVKPLLSENVVLYSTKFDDLGINYIPSAGTIETKIETQRLVERELVHSLYKRHEFITNAESFQKLEPAIALEWITKEKENLTLINKEILGTIRDLILCMEKKQSSKNFILSLDDLMNKADEASFAQIPLKIFKFYFDSLYSKNLAENTKVVESLLYALKDDLHKAVDCLHHAEIQIGSLKVKKMIEKSRAQAEL